MSDEEGHLETQICNTPSFQRYHKLQTPIRPARCFLEKLEVVGLSRCSPEPHPSKLTNTFSDRDQKSSFGRRCEKGEEGIESDTKRPLRGLLPVILGENYDDGGCTTQPYETPENLKNPESMQELGTRKPGTFPRWTRTVWRKVCGLAQERYQMPQECSPRILFESAGATRTTSCPCLAVVKEFVKIQDHRGDSTSKT